MSNINREALLRAAEGLLSSESDRSSDERSRSRSPSRKRSRSEKTSKASKRHKKHKEKHSKRHKRSEHDKIRELERKAAAIGATSLISRVPRGLGALATAAGSSAGDAVVLDTAGDPNNMMFESLYAGSVPRYHRVDPMNLVNSNRYNWQMQLADKDAGNTTANRYYKGRNLLVERSRQTKRLHLSDLRPKAHTLSANPQQQQGFLPFSTTSSSSNWLSMLAGLPQQCTASKLGDAPAMQHTEAGLDTAAQELAPQATSSSSSRRLVMPAPAFIPLEPPDELIKAATAADDDVNSQGATGAAAGQYGGAGFTAAGRKPAAIDPEALIEQAGLTVDEFVLKATRAWNIAVREHPEDEQLWLDFAAFQSVAARLLQQQRGRSDAAAAAIAEKQVSLLSRGLTHHPHSESLLLALLRSYAVIAPDAAALDEKWRGVLARQPGSWMLWREYLALKNSRFASFTVSSLQQSYQEALHSMHMELLVTRRKAAAAHKQQHGSSSPPQLTQQQLEQMSPAAAAAAVSGSSSSGPAMLLPVCYREEQLELQMVQLLLALMYHELVAGYSEQVVAKMQAILEYQLYQPPTPPGGASALLRLFAAFWDSPTAAAARIGEPGARGWAYWCCWHTMGLEPPSAAAAAAVEGDEAVQQQEEEEPAGWSGWFEVPKQQQQQEDQQHQQEVEGRKKHKQQRQDASAVGADNTEQATHLSDQQQQQQSTDDESEEGEAADEPGSEDEEVQEEDEDEEIDEVDLMLQLGIQLEEQLQEVEQQGLPTHIVKRWASEEASRSSSQWHPQRQQQQPDTADGQETPEPSRIVSFDAVEPCIFTIRSMTALRRLVLGSVELLGAPVGAWCSSNCPTPMQQLSPEVPPACISVTCGPRSGGVTSGTSGGSVSKSLWSDASSDGFMQNAGSTAAAGAQSSVAANAQQRQQQWQQQRRPWYEGSDERWQFLVSVLERLVAGGPCGSWPELCNALLLLHARKPSNAAAASSSSGSDQVVVLQQPLTIDGGCVAAATSSSSSSSAESQQQQQLAAVRAAAKQLLSDQRDNLLLYDAYGCCEAATQQVKTARKVLGSALALATAAGSSSSSAASSNDAAMAAAAMPQLALHLAQLELSTGGKGATERALAALHACLAQEIYQPAAAAAAAAAKDSGQQQQQQQGLMAEAATIRARRGFQDQIQQLLSSAGGGFTPAAAATVAAAGLYELTLGLLLTQPAKGLTTAAAVYKQVLAAVPEAIRAASEQHEQLYILYCHMMVAAAVGAVDRLVPAPAAAAVLEPSAAAAAASSSTVAAALMSAVSPFKARSILAAALQLYPTSQGLLNLQVWLDHSCYTLTGLRRQLAALSELNPSPGLWRVALQVEGLRPGGRVRLRALFERALQAPTTTQWQQQQQVQRQRRMQALAAPGLTQQQQQQKDATKQQDDHQQRHLRECTAASRSSVLLDLAVQDGYRGWGSCSALWEQYIWYELSLGRPEAARKLFLRAVHECPGFKGLWLLGFSDCSDGMQPREASGLMTAMQEREVLVRTDVYEVLLADLAEKQQQQ